MPVAANHGTDMITKIVPIRPPIWRGLRLSHPTTQAPGFWQSPDYPPLKTPRDQWATLAMLLAARLSFVLIL